MNLPLTAFEKLSLKAKQKYQANVLSNSLFEINGVEFCANGTVSIISYNAAGTKRQRVPFAKNRTPYHMAMIIKNLFDEPRKL